MPNGVVYFMPKILELIAKKQAEKAGVLEVVSMDDKEMREVLLSIVHQLRQENVIAGGLLKDNYFGIQAGVGVDLWFVTIDARIESSSNIFIKKSNFSATNRVYLISAGIKLF